jgi:hypothetical protein
MTHRITIEITTEERRQLRMDAALLDMSVTKLARMRVTGVKNGQGVSELGSELTPAKRAVLDR